MWFGRKRRLKEIAELRKAIADTQKEQVPTMVAALFEALGKFSQVQVDFAKGLADINVKRSAALIGSRGGKRTQEKKRQLRIATDCSWCKGETSNTALDWHRQHHLNGTAPTQPQGDASPNTH